MKKIVLACVIIASFILFSLMYNQSGSGGLPLINSTGADAANRSSSSSVTVTSSGSNPAGTTSVVSGPGTTYKDGTYTGSVADAYWGNIQVQAVIQGGKISSVTFLEYPNDRNRSVSINQYADPILSNEAIQAQSANVDIVTGATDTSDAFIQSLSDALSQA